MGIIFATFVAQNSRVMKKVTAVLVLCLAFVAMRAQEDSLREVKTITLDQAVQIALSENISVKIADQEIKRTQYAKKGTYAALFPTIDATGSFQRTIKKQKMYMDVPVPGMEDGLEVGRWNTWSMGGTATMPIVNAQLWKSIAISGQDVELAVEKARSSRIETVSAVKQAFYAVLLAKEAFGVYKSVYENAAQNFEQTQKKYNALRASELDLTRAKTNLANAVPDVYDSESAILITLWQLKAVMGVDLDENIDVAGSLTDYADELQVVLYPEGGYNLDNNSAMRQLAIQAEQLANAVRLQKYAYIPTLSLAFTYSINAMDNAFVFSDYKWTPYSYVGLSLNIPIFSGGKRLNSVRQAKVQATELALQRSNTERQLQIAIRQSLNQMETAVKSYSSAESAVETAEKAYQIASQSYEVGRSTLTDLSASQLSLTQAQLALCQAVYTYLSAKASLESTLGSDITR